MISPALQALHPQAAFDHRVETKYRVTPGALAATEFVLRSRLTPDPHWPTGRVCSIYFDTADRKSYWESIDGEDVKVKIRVRWYEGSTQCAPLGENAYLEIKTRNSNSSQKFRVQKPFQEQIGAFQQATSIVNRYLRQMPGLSARILEKPVEPVLQINYKRLRFRDTCSDARVNLDSQIASLPLGAEAIPFRAWKQLPAAVLEVKNQQGSLPDVLCGMLPQGVLRSAFSKYALSLALHEEVP